MAKAKMHNGVAIVAYVKGHAVDAFGNEIEGAPPATPDTDPRDQIKAQQLSPEARLGSAVGEALAYLRTHPV